MAPALVGASVAAQSATQQGVLNAGQGMRDAIKTRTQALNGGFAAITGAIQTGMYDYANRDLTGDDDPGGDTV
jgi:hypothetical protein